MSKDLVPPYDDLVTQVIEPLYRADQLDRLHLSLITMLDMVKDGEIDLILESAEKTPKSKLAFLQKVVDNVTSSELQGVLQPPLTAKNFDFFREGTLGTLLQRIRVAAENMVIVKLTVALKFKEADLKKMAAICSEKIGVQVVLSLRVDPELIGGAIVQYGSYLSDYSLKTQLDLFRHNWHRAVVDQG